MKPIIVDIKDMSDITEVYESRPNRFLIYTIYVILIIIVVAVMWMCLSKMDIVVKSNGTFKGSNEVYEISSGVTGSVKEKHVLSGQYVDEGDVLFVLNIDELSDTIVRYQNEQEASKDRLKILLAYEKSLDGGKKELEVCADNPYYDEYINRLELLYANMNLNESSTSGQSSLYQGNIDSISRTIAKYKEKVDKLNAVKQCITARNNTFDGKDSYYYSIVNSYLASYSYTALQYDNQINKYQKQIDEYDKKIEGADGELSKEDEALSIEKTVICDYIPVEADFQTTLSNNATTSMDSLKEQRDSLVAECDLVKKEKSQALLNLELQQITSIEQQISGYNDTILSMETNLTSAKLQLETVNSVDNKSEESVAILTEKGSIAAEILSYENKVKECETYLKSYDIQNDNCTIKANVSGYFYTLQDLKTGSYVQEGTAIGVIYPEQESKYYAEIYVENSDIAKVKEGQKVKFEVAAYPSSEYGYFEGTVENIAKDISVDQSKGQAYYLVRVKCNNMSLKGNDGEEVTLMNGMACQTKIVVDEKNVLTYIFEKLDLLD